MVSDRIIEAVNRNPALLSALYDMNLLPEQVKTDNQIGALTYFVVGFELGKTCLSQKEPKT
jgi:hypothetical protein